MYIGIDVGGTSVKWGIIDNQLNIVEKSSFPTNKESDIALLQDICAVVNEKKKKYKFDYVGIGSPGLVDSSLGVIKGSSNTPFKNTNAADIITRLTGLKAYVENDANCAAFGEFCASGATLKNVIMLTLGTGVGGGIIIDGKLFSGSSGKGGELGHMIISHGGKKCPCGRNGCFEAYASVTALIKMFRERLEKDGTIGGAKLSAEEIDGKKIFELASFENEVACSLLSEYFSYLASGIDTLINIFDPELIVLAGGITNQKETLIKHLQPHLKPEWNIQISRLGNDAGFIGAALLGK